MTDKTALEAEAKRVERKFAMYFAIGWGTGFLVIFLMGCLLLPQSLIVFAIVGAFAGLLPGAVLGGEYVTRYIEGKEN